MKPSRTAIRPRDAINEPSNQVFQLEYLKIDGSDEESGKYLSGVYVEAGQQSLAVQIWQELARSINSPWAYLKLALYHLVSIFSSSLTSRTWASWMMLFIASRVVFEGLRGTLSHGRAWASLMSVKGSSWPLSRHSRWLQRQIRSQYMLEYKYLDIC